MKVVHVFLNLLFTNDELIDSVLSVALLIKVTKVKYIMIYENK